MANSLIEQLRALLLDMKQRSLERHKTFAECEDGFAKRRDILDESWQSSHQVLEETHRQRQQAMQRQYDETLQGITDHHDQEHIRLTDEADTRRTNIEVLYAADRAAADAKFKEAHWTTQTLNESDKRVARDQILRAHHRLKQNRSELKSHYYKTAPAHSFLEIRRESDVQFELSVQADAGRSVEEP